MNKIAYLANSFPEAVEPYVWEEIRELRSRGQAVVACSFRHPKHIPEQTAGLASEAIYLFPLRIRLAIHASWLCILRLVFIVDLLWRAMSGSERIERRLRTLAHTWLGVYLAIVLRKENIGHVHVHHGYFSSWAGMVAARLLGATFSMTLHGSDLLVRADYLDCKLRHCRFCITISEFNRNYICQHYPSIDPGKILVHRLGVDVNFWRPVPRSANHLFFSIISVGRLHSIKNHEFLIRACYELKAAGLNFRCTIAGEGGERERLQSLIRKLRLGNDVTLCGHVRREQLPLLYSQADVVVLTSRCEGIPQALMEAMAMERTVVAPAITGISELIANERTGFLYEANSMQDFLTKMFHIAAATVSLDELRYEARRHLYASFNHDRNLRSWADDFLRHIDRRTDNEELLYANPVLQEVQLPVQRNRSIPV